MHAWLLLASLACADKAPIDPADAKARALADATLAFPRPVFMGKRFPLARLQHGPALKDVLTDETPIVTRFYDAKLEPATRPTKPGPYAVHVILQPKGERPITRFITLFEPAKEVAADRRYKTADLADFARDMGLDPAVVKRHEEVIVKTLRDRPYAEWSADPAMARLLAGLALAKPIEGPLHSYDDAYAAERQWWVDLKRKRIYADKKFATVRFTGPSTLATPAPVVRAGTEEEAGFTKGTADKLDAVLTKFAADTDHAFAVCLVRHGVIVLHKAYGERDGKPMTIDTPSWMASVTKTMSATLMLELIDQGLVGLDDPVSKYLPALRGIPMKKPLTIHHLYTHTSGLTVGWPGWSDDLHDVPERIAAYADRVPVGKDWNYTGTGNTLGSKAFEMVTGTAIPVAYHQYLFGPLGCTGTRVTDTHAGGTSIPLDMAKFAQMLLNRGSYGKRRFFREETFIKVMLPGKLDKLLGPGAKRQFGFGLDGSPKQFGHGTASGAVFHIDAARDLVFVMTRNKYGKNQDKYNGLIWKVIDDGIK
jgi:CubicO group peptidase (beta-lactamase class C family)